MKNLYKWSLFHSLGILVYIGLVATLIFNGEAIFGEMNNFIGPVAFLLLFTLSALIVGGLALGKPIMLYLDNKKKEAVSFILMIAGWLTAFTIITLIISAVTK